MKSEEAEQRIIDGSAWRDFCDELKAAGDAILRDGNPEDAFNRAEGIRYLSRLTRAGLEAQVEFGDPRFPGFYQLSNETIKIGNDNPDNCYLNSTISGRYDYRIRGERGTVPYLSLGTKAGGYETSGTMVPTGQIDAKDMKIAPDGSFEILMSCRPQPGNWLPMKPETTQLIVRQTFSDRGSEEAATLEIECLNGDALDVLDPSALEAKLKSAAHFVQNTSNLFIDWMQRYSGHINELPSDDQKKCQDAGGDASIHYFQSYWKLADDEALIIRPDRIPKCAAWNFQLSNYWMESLDYRNHKIWVNNHTAVYDEEDNVTIVVAGENPGSRFPNWLETTNHGEGGMLFRWIDAESHPPIRTEVVKLSELPRD
jgi:hypothetical protein